LADALKRVLDDAPFTGREVATTLPAASVTYKSLRLPTMPEHELAAAVQFEAADRGDGNDKAGMVQHFNAGQVRQGSDVRQEVIAMSVTPKALDEHIEVLTQCGLEPIAIDVTPAAMARCAVIAKPMHVSEDQADLIVDIGFNTSKVVIARRGRVLFFKEIDIAGRHFAAQSVQQATSRIANTSQDTEATTDAQPSDTDEPAESRGHVAGLLEQLGREIGLCLRYYSVTFRGERPREALLIGGQVTQPQVAQGLAGVPGVAFRALDVFTNVKPGPMSGRIGEGAKAAPWAIAASLSRRAAMIDTRKGAA